MLALVNSAVACRRALYAVIAGAACDLCGWRKNLRGEHSMKKLMTLLLGLSIALGGTWAFANDSPSTTQTKAKKTTTKKPKVLTSTDKKS